MKRTDFQILHDVSTAIATVRNKDDLFQVILEKINPVFDCEREAVVLIVDEQQEYYRILLSAFSKLPESEAEFYRSRQFPVDPVIKRILDTEGPVIFQTDHLIEQYPEAVAEAGPKLVQMLGVKEFMSCRLLVRGHVIGKFTLHSERIDHFRKTNFRLFKAVADLVGVALSNILRTEEAGLRESQNSQLVKISKHIASVKDRDDLFRLIAKELKAFLHFDDVVIAVIDEKAQNYRVFLSDVAGTTSQHKEFKDAQTRIYPIQKGTYAHRVYHSEAPLIIDIEQVLRYYPESQNLRFAYNFGMRDQIAHRLTYSGKVIGMFAFLSRQQGSYTQKDAEIVRSLSSLLAIALNNILAYQELLVREHQKSQLLRISSNIAGIRDKSALFRLLAEDVKSFVDFDDAALSVVDEESDSFGVFLSNFNSDIVEHADYERIAALRHPIEKDSLPYRVIRSEKPMIADIKVEMFRNPEHKYLNIAYQFGFREEILTRLTHSGRVIGVFVLLSRTTGRFTESDIETMYSLSSLIAIALNNILVNEELESLSKQLEQDNVYLNEEIKSSHNFEEIIGESLPIREVCKKAVQVAHADSTVLILGETGTGKELIARAVHNLSSRKGRPLIKVNCAALPAQLIESELFGHEKGSFTGATDKRIGKFELANGSTIFLDEIGELPLELQAKLLRVLQEREIERVGGEKSIRVDVRIIAATNRVLENEVSAGRFRSDLYYRLNIYPIELPPLRERKDDIPLLASFFLNKLSHKLGKRITSMSPSVMEELMSNDWPGNIRELEHAIERSMLLASGKSINSLNLSKPIFNNSMPSIGGFEPKRLAENERELIIKTLQYTKGKIRGSRGAAELLDILPTTLEARMKKLGIKKEFVAER